MRPFSWKTLELMRSFNEKCLFKWDCIAEKRLCKWEGRSSMNFKICKPQNSLQPKTKFIFANSNQIHLVDPLKTFFMRKVIYRFCKIHFNTFGPDSQCDQMANLCFSIFGHFKKWHFKSGLVYCFCQSRFKILSTN